MMPSGLYGLAVSGGASNQSILCVTMYPYRSIKIVLRKRIGANPQLSYSDIYSASSSSRTSSGIVNGEYRLREFGHQRRISTLQGLPARYTPSPLRPCHQKNNKAKNGCCDTQCLGVRSRRLRTLTDILQEKPSVAVYPQFASRKL
jgi:hypothetical protein